MCCQYFPTKKLENEENRMFCEFDFQTVEIQDQNLIIVVTSETGFPLELPGKLQKN